MNNSPLNKRRPEEIEADLLLISQWLSEGKYHHEIAEEISKIRKYTLSRQQISFDVKKIEARWRAATLENTTDLKAKQLRDLRMRQRELYRAWERSKLDSVRQFAEESTDGHEGGNGGGKHQKKRLTKEGQCGDAAFMKLILDIDDKIMRLLGIEAPSKHELSGPQGTPLQVQANTDLSHLTAEQVDAIYAIIGDSPTQKVAE
jgi:hypothetical protein